MSGHNDSVLVQRLEVVHTGRRRRWRLDEKLRIVSESFEGHRQVSAVARRHDISRSQLYAWRRALGGGCRDHDEVPGFSRAVMVPETAPDGLVCAGAGRMEVWG
jgi:transposase